jgi:dihydrodipicolinate synthase/N-acetylneuraminate lyase
VSVLVYGGLSALVVTDRLGRTTRRRLLTGASGLMVLGTVGNLATQSPVERLWAPVAATLAVMLWRVRGSR